VAVALIAIGAAAWVACFVASVALFSTLREGSPVPPGILGVPWATAGLVLFTFPVGAGTVMLAGRGAAARAARRPVLGGFLIVAGLVGLWAAWTLTVDKVITLVSPEAHLGCDFSLLVQCGANLSSAQGAVLGFPNPLLGLAGWAAVLVMGVALIAGAPQRQWFRLLYALGTTGAMALVLWLIGQSVFVLGTLCPWCMVTWSVTIPVFWSAWGHLLAHSARELAARIGSAVLSWTPLLTVLSYTVVAILAQLRLDFLSML